MNITKLKIIIEKKEILLFFIIVINAIQLLAMAENKRALQQNNQSLEINSLNSFDSALKCH